LFRGFHSSLFPVRVWTQTTILGEQKGPPGETKADEKAAGKLVAQLSKEQMRKIEGDFDLQTKRLSDFIAVGTGKIEQMRLRTNEDGFFRYSFVFFSAIGELSISHQRCST
jgi:hypothetical protein